MNHIESSVRSYCRTFPVMFQTASGSSLFDVSGKKYIDFLCCAGALSYGHNDPTMKQALLDYVQRDGVTSSLDLATEAKSRFLECFESMILVPRSLNYRIQFTGPTGANAVEAALKIARKATARSHVLAFTNSYHGLSSGALAVTADSYYRHESFLNRANVSFLPFDGYFGAEIDTLPYIKRLVEDPASGLGSCAAVILETIQAEGGVNVARCEWLRGIEDLCRRNTILLIVDDIQTGCGRTGKFFSFEESGISPDIITLSKGISGFGLPMSLVLLKPDVDQWQPGEHTGTFRGNNLAFITAEAALKYWQDDTFEASIRKCGALFGAGLRALACQFGIPPSSVRGKGLLWGLELSDEITAAAVVRSAFVRGLIAERCGPRRSVLKFLPPYCCTETVLEDALKIISEAMAESVCSRKPAICA